MRTKLWLSFLLTLVFLLMLILSAFADDSVYVGQTFYFGHYEQDGNLYNGSESILWRIYSIDYSSRTVCAVSEYGLDAMVYNYSTSWGNSAIRSWLNSTFLSSAFSAAEQSQMYAQYVSNSYDFVFLLNQWEIECYLDTEMLYCTEYARQHGAYVASDTGTCSYWVRQDASSTFGTFVGAHGSFYDHGNKVTEHDNAVRPAVCLSFDAVFGRLNTSVPAQTCGELSAVTLKPIATRSGPSTKYDELGTYWKEGGHNVTVISRASGNDIWWLQIEFEYNGQMVRVYTGQQRVNIDVDLVPIEGGAYAEGYVSMDTTPYYGPGTNYKQHTTVVSAGTVGSVISTEDGYVCLEFQQTKASQRRRVWLLESNVFVY